MAAANIQCPEVEGKTISRLQLIQPQNGSQEILLEFTDGTAFSMVVEAKTTRDARLIAQSEAAPETIRSYSE